MTQEAPSILDYSREEVLPFASALSNLFLDVFTGLPEFSGKNLQGFQLAEDEHYHFERGRFMIGTQSYDIVIGEGKNGESELGISRSLGGEEKKSDHYNVESVVIYRDDKGGASISYFKGTLGSSSVDSARHSNTIAAVEGAYGFLNNLEDMIDQTREEKNT